MAQELNEGANLTDVKELFEDLDEDFKYFSNAIGDSEKSEYSHEYYYSLAEIVAYKVENSDQSAEIKTKSLEKAEIYLKKAKNGANLNGGSVLIPFIDDLSKKIEGLKT